MAKANAASGTEPKDDAASSRDPAGGKVKRITVVSAGLGEPSSTTRLAQDVAVHARDFLSGHGIACEITVVALKDLAPDIVSAAISRPRSKPLDRAIARVRSSDALVVGTPVFKAGYTGLFKSFWDVIESDAVIDMPVALTATGDTERHALVPDMMMRPLFAFLRALVIPTSVMAAGSDWASPGLSAHVERAGGELAAMMLVDLRGAVMNLVGGHYRRSFDAGVGNLAGMLDFDSALMHLAAGGAAVTR